MNFWYHQAGEEQKQSQLTIVKYPKFIVFILKIDGPVYILKVPLKMPQKGPMHMQVMDLEA